MARKKASVKKFPGKWENLHVLIKNLEGETGTHYGYVLVTVSPEPGSSPVISENYSGANRYNRNLIGGLLEALAEQIEDSGDE